MHVLIILRYSLTSGKTAETKDGDCEKPDEVFALQHEVEDVAEEDDER